MLYGRMRCGCVLHGRGMSHSRLRALWLHAPGLHALVVTMLTRAFARFARSLSSTDGRPPMAYCAACVQFRPLRSSAPRVLASPHLGDEAMASAFTAAELADVMGAVMGAPVPGGAAAAVPDSWREDASKADASAHAMLTSSFKACEVWQAKQVRVGVDCSLGRKE